MAVEHEDDAERKFVDSHMEPRHAVAVAMVSKGSKRHTLLAELADDEASWVTLTFISWIGAATIVGHGCDLQEG